MRVVSISFLVIVVAVIVGGYCRVLIDREYNKTGKPWVSFHMLAYPYTDEFQHPNKALIVGGYTGALIIGFAALAFMVVSLGKTRQENRDQKTGSSVTDSRKAGDVK
jgi:hypothetical protein